MAGAHGRVLQLGRDHRPQPRARLFPYEGAWHQAEIHAQLERYRHPFLVAGATGSGNERERRGPEVPDLVLSSLRRKEGKLVARVANELPRTTQGLQPWEIRSIQLG